MGPLSQSSVATFGDDLHREHGRFLWSLCYRMTGSAADADDLVQETFLRALERPPPRLDAPWRPWLVRVAVNLARDAYRRRRRREYPGTWLPSPIETSLEEDPRAYEADLGEGRTTEGRYELLEGVSFAFLLALETLTPLQRAVLLLRDVFDYDVRATAEALDVSPSNVKTTHHRARRALAATRFGADRVRPDPDRPGKTRAVLERFLTGLAAGDVTVIESLLAEGVRATSDAGGEFSAAHNVVVGRDRVTRLTLGLAAKYGTAMTASLRLVNGEPAVLIEVSGATGRAAPRFVLRIELDADDRIVEVQSILATRKLTAIR